MWHCGSAPPSPPVTTMPGWWIPNRESGALQSLEGVTARINSHGTRGSTGLRPINIASVTRLCTNAWKRRKPYSQAGMRGHPASERVCDGSLASATSAVACGSASARVWLSKGAPCGVSPRLSSRVSQNPCARSQKSLPALDQHTCGKHFHIFVMCTKVSGAGCAADQSACSSAPSEASHMGAIISRPRFGRRGSTTPRGTPDVSPAGTSTWAPEEMFGGEQSGIHNNGLYKCSPKKAQSILDGPVPFAIVSMEDGSNGGDRASIRRFHWTNFSGWRVGSVTTRL
mmetsp:Transcript_12356/g.37858  ORF Transcript_12356/g.37858 Transcript_12356/m.37858 type:complete len:285 (-) Transcript_12356:623-1477(-)